VSLLVSSQVEELLQFSRYEPLLLLDAGSLGTEIVWTPVI
jgi:hypothetical protein